MKYIFFTLLLFWLVGCSSIVNSVAFHPDSRSYLPSEGLPTFVEEVSLVSSKKSTLWGYFLKNENSQELIIYFHGNAGNIAHRMRDLVILREMGYNVLGVSYRGYGKSSGKPSEKGIYQDGEAILQYGQDSLNFPLNKITLLGRSIGSTVATHCAQQRELTGVILVTPLTSGKEQAQMGGMGILSSVAGKSFDNSSRIKAVTAPLLIVHGTKDRVIPYGMGETLYQKANKPKSFVSIEGAGHNDLSTRFSGEYWLAIQRFFQYGKEKR